MTSEGLGEMFEGDSADMCADIFSLMSMGGRADGLACADLGVRTPISVSRNFIPKMYKLAKGIYASSPNIWSIVQLKSS